MYGDEISDVTIYDSNPFLSSLKNSRLDGDIGGRGAYVPVRTAPPPCVGGNLPTGEVGFNRLVENSVNRGSSYSAFLYTHAKIHGISHLTVDQLLLSDSKAKAFVDLTLAEKDGLIKHISKQLEQYLFDQGFGRVGRIALGSTVNTATITLEDQCDGTNFEKGMELVAAVDIGTSVIRGVSTNGAFVSSVAYTAANNTATITLGAAANDGTNGLSTAVAAGDTLFIRNSRDPGASPVKSVPDGLGSHLPGTSTAHDTFYLNGGQTRANNTRLKGLFLDATNMPIVEALLFAEQLAYSNGAKLDAFWCSPARLRRIQFELIGRIQYNEASVMKTAGVNFKAIEFVGMSGNTIRIMASRGCSDRVMFGLESSGWSYRTIHEGPVAVFDGDGNDWLRTVGDSVQLRAHSRGQLVGTSHGHNIRVDLGPL